MSSTIEAVATLTAIYDPPLQRQGDTTPIHRLLCWIDPEGLYHEETLKPTARINIRIIRSPLIRSAVIDWPGKWDVDTLLRPSLRKQVAPLGI